MMRWIAVLACLFVPAAIAHSQAKKTHTDPASSQLTEDNSLFEADQNDRKAGKIDDATLKRDESRREQVLEQLRGGNVRTAKDHYHAAMVFQHGKTADDIRLAFSLAWLSAQLDPENDDRWAILTLPIVGHNVLRRCTA